MKSRFYEKELRRKCREDKAREYRFARHRDEVEADYRRAVKSSRPKKSINPIKVLAIVTIALIMLRVLASGMSVGTRYVLVVILTAVTSFGCYKLAKRFGIV